MVASLGLAIGALAVAQIARGTFIAKEAQP